MKRGLRKTALAITLAFSMSAAALSGMSQVARQGTPVASQIAEFRDWPVGTLDLVNDPARANGWNPWFSELPNDAYVFEYRLTGQIDLGRIVEKLAKIHGKVHVRLDPRRAIPSRLHVFTSLEGSDLNASLQIGCQKELDQWYAQLPIVNEQGEELGELDQLLDPGPSLAPVRRKFGVTTYTSCPEATPPTLTLYVGHPAMDVSHLEIPAHIEVTGAATNAYRNEHPEDPVMRAIDQFIAGRTGQTLSKAE